MKLRDISRRAGPPEWAEVVAMTVGAVALALFLVGVLIKAGW
ncbi:MAG: hypothetical protein WC683_08195 [bacterium]